MAEMDKRLVRQEQGDPTLLGPSPLLNQLDWCRRVSICR